MEHRSGPPLAAELTTEQIFRATRGTYAAFIAAGFAFASWAGRIPQIRDGLHLSSADLGLVILAVAAGALVALPIAGIIVHRFDSRHTVAAMSMLLAAGLALVGIGYRLDVAVVVVGLFVVGFANGGWDVAMNVHGATVERHRRRAIMPRFHAGFSVGTVAGALLAALMVALHVSVTVHLIGVGVVVALTVPIATQDFVAGEHARSTDRAADEPAPRRSTALSRWTEPRTLLIGVVVLAFAFTEGSGNDWISIALIDGYRTPASVGTLGLAVFLAAMTAVRWFGTGLLDRYGRVTVLRGLSIVGVAGLLLFVFSPVTPLAFLGAALWGAGASLGFPVGMSAASDEAAAAAGRVSVVASIGYCAFLGGPPLIGFLGSHDSVLHALLSVAVLLGVAVLLLNAVRPPQDG